MQVKAKLPADSRVIVVCQVICATSSLPTSFFAVKYRCKYASAKHAFAYVL